MTTIFTQVFHRTRTAMQTAFFLANAIDPFFTVEYKESSDYARDQVNLLTHLVDYFEGRIEISKLSVYYEHTTTYNGLPIKLVVDCTDIVTTVSLDLVSMPLTDEVVTTLYNLLCVLDSMHFKRYEQSKKTVQAKTQKDEFRTKEPTLEQEFFVND